MIMPALDDPTTEAGSDSSSPEGQRLQSEILSLQQEARLKKQQLAEVAASVDQKRDAVDFLRADDRTLHRRHLQSMKSLVQSKEDLSRKERLKSATALHRANLGLDDPPSLPPPHHSLNPLSQTTELQRSLQDQLPRQFQNANSMFAASQPPAPHHQSQLSQQQQQISQQQQQQISQQQQHHHHSNAKSQFDPTAQPPDYHHRDMYSHYPPPLQQQQPMQHQQPYLSQPQLHPESSQQQHQQQGYPPLQPSSSMPNVSSAAAAELAQQLQTHHSIMTESILAKRKELNRIEDEVDEVNKAFRNAKKNLAESTTLSDAAAASLTATRHSIAEEASKLEYLLSEVESAQVALAAKTQSLAVAAADEVERKRILQRVVDVTKKKDEEFRRLVEGVEEAEERKRELEDEIDKLAESESELSSDLDAKQSLVASSSSDFEKLSSDLENGRAELKSLDQALGAQRTALAVANRAADKRREETKALAKEAEEVIQGKNSEIEDLRFELESLAAAKEETGLEVGRLKREWAALKRRGDEEVEAVEKLKEAKAKADEELQATRDAGTLAKNELQSTLHEAGNRYSALTELKSSITVNDDVLAKLVALRKEAEKDVEGLSDMLKGLKNDVDVMTSEKSAVETEVRELYKQKKIYETESNQLKSAAEEANRHRDEATHQVHVTHGRVERLKNEIDCLEREIKGAKDERQQIEKQKMKEAEEMDELKDEMLFLKDEIQSGQDESKRVHDDLKSLRSTREETLLEIRREEERLNLTRKRREEEEEETRRVEEERGIKAEERMLVEKEWESALQKLVRTRKEIEAEERRMEDVADDKRCQLQHLDRRLDERMKELGNAEREMAEAVEESARRKATTKELTRLEEEVEKWKRKVDEKERERQGVEAEKENLLGSVASVTEELAMVRLSIAEENTDREKIVADLERELRQVKDTHHASVSTLTSKLQSAIEGRQKAESKSSAHLLQATSLAEEVAGVRQELVDAKQQLVEEKQQLANDCLRQRGEKHRVSRAIGELRADVFDALEERVVEAREEVNRGVEVGERSGRPGLEVRKRSGHGAASEERDNKHIIRKSATKSTAYGRFGAGAYDVTNINNNSTNNDNDDFRENVSPIETVRSPEVDVLNSSSVRRLYQNERNFGSGGGGEIAEAESDAENDDSLAHQIDLLRENMAAARKTLNVVEGKGGSGDDGEVGEGGGGGRCQPGNDREPLHDLSNVMPASRNTNTALYCSDSNSKETSSVNNSHFRLPSSSSYSSHNHSQPMIIPSLLLSNVVTPSKTSPATEDPYRRHGQVQFLEEEVRLKRALRDQMASHAERLSARMSKMSSTSLEALQRKVENLEDIMDSDAQHRGEKGRRLYPHQHRRQREDRGGGGGKGLEESGYRISNPDTSYRSISAPLGRSFDVSLPLTPGSTRIPPQTNVITPPSGVRRRGGGGGGGDTAPLDHHLGESDAFSVRRTNSSKKLDFRSDEDNR